MRKLNNAVDNVKKMNLIGKIAIIALICILLLIPFIIMQYFSLINIPILMPLFFIAFAVLVAACIITEKDKISFLYMIVIHKNHVLINSITAISKKVKII